MRGQAGFFDVDERLKRLSGLGDHLEAFAAAVDFEMFRADLVAALGYSDGARGGRPPFDPVMMFKILVIQAMDNLSDERAEFLINDRMSFMRFLGLSLADRVPDARTIWLFREKLTMAGAIEPLFARFDAALRASGDIAMSGQIVDATLVAAPKQRNTEDEKKAIKEGRIPEGWATTPAKLRRKDRDARWTVTFSKARARPDGTKPPVDVAIPTFGYQNHIAIDRGFGFISRIHRKKPKGRPMPDAVHRANAMKSTVRSRVEHVFAEQKDRMGLFIRTIGIARARVKIGMANLVYNFKRLVFWRRIAAA